MSLWRRILVERRSLALPLGALLAVNAVVLMAVVLPLQRSVSGGVTRRSETTLKLNLAKKELAETERIANSKRQAADDLRTFYETVLPASQSEATREVAIWPDRTAKQLGLQYTSIDTTNPTEIRDSRLMQVTSRFTLRGDYQNIRRFVYTVEAAEKFLVIDKIKLAQLSAQQPGSSALEFELSISTYYLGGGK
jgi:Tfp pilus assembly protein PilO